MAPLSTHHEHEFHEVVAVWIRRAILIFAFGLICLPFLELYFYEMTMQHTLSGAVDYFTKWFEGILKQHWWKLIPAIMLGWSIKFAYNRYVLTFISGIARKLRRRQSDDKPSDILEENSRFKAKEFLPSKYYSPEGIFIGLDEHNNPVRVAWDEWRSNMMQVIGPTGYGKGVILGELMDQIIRKGDTLFYIDPKDDEWAPHVMFAACQAAGRKFYYVSLHDGELGSWGPFLGGKDNDGWTRLEIALGLELTGDPGTDFYKTQEISTVRAAFRRTKRVDSLFNEIQGEGANKSEAELRLWKEYSSLCAKPNKGFSIEAAIKENAVVYLKGSLDDRIIKTATKIFIVELMQECRRLYKTGDKKNHLTAVIDEVAFLVSVKLKEALATIRGFGVNLVNAYQSPEDLVNTDDININGRALKQSMDVNSQIKAVYGGADFETAEWAANLSGTTVKEVTKLERTDVKYGGGETWETNRTIGTLEEPLVHANVILSLPKRVCVFVQPGQLLKPVFTSHVPVNDKNALPSFLKSKAHKPPKESESDTLASSSVVPDTEDDEHLEHFQNLSETRKIVDPFIPGSGQSPAPEPTASAPESTPNTEIHAFKNEAIEDTIEVPTEAISHAKPPSETQEDALLSEAEIAKREKNRERRKKQKQRRKEQADRDVTGDLESVSAGTSTTGAVEVDGDLEHFLENVKSDSDLLRSLSEAED